MTHPAGYDDVRNPQDETDYAVWFFDLLLILAPSALFFGLCALANWAHR